MADPACNASRAPAPDRPDTAETADAAALGRWLLAVVPALFLALLLLRATTNSDAFWQIRLGQLTLDAGGPIRREPFSALHLGEPIAALSWLGHAVMALALRLGGWSGLRLVDAASWCGGFWAIAWVCRRHGAASIVLAATLALAFLVALPTAILRPQSFAVLGFGLFLALLRADLKPATKLLAAVPLLLLWQNLHPSVSLAVVAAAAAAGGGWLAWLRSRNRQVRPAGMPLSETLLVPVAAAAMLCTPDGLSIFAISARNTEMSIMIGASEWYPLWHPMNRALALLTAIVAGLAAMAVWRRRGRVDLRELAVAIAFGLMAVLFYRFVVFWALALIPLLARTGIAALDQLVLPPGVSALTARRIPAASAAIVTICVGAALSLLNPVTFRPHLALPAIAKLRDQQVTGTVFADFPLGGPLIYMGHPGWKVAYDGRYYHYNRTEWSRFAAIQSGEFGLDEVVAQYQPVAFVLNLKRNARLVAELERRGGEWREIERTGRVAVFVRRR